MTIRDWLHRNLRRNSDQGIKEVASNGHCDDALQVEGRWHSQASENGSHCTTSCINGRSRLLSRMRCCSGRMCNGGGRYDDDDVVKKASNEAVYIASACNEDAEALSGGAETVGVVLSSWQHGLLAIGTFGGVHQLESSEDSNFGSASTADIAFGPPIGFETVDDDELHKDVEPKHNCATSSNHMCRSIPMKEISVEPQPIKLQCKSPLSGLICHIKQYSAHIFAAKSHKKNHEKGLLTNLTKSELNKILMTRWKKGSTKLKSCKLMRLFLTKAHQSTPALKNAELRCLLASSKHDDQAKETALFNYEDIEVNVQYNCTLENVNRVQCLFDVGQDAVDNHVKTQAELSGRQEYWITTDSEYVVLEW